MTSFRLYFRLVGASLRCQMQYRASFLMMFASLFFITFTEFVAICVLFARFGALRGWGLAEVGLFYGLIQVGFALGEAAGRGFDTFSGLVRTGGFDRILLRPRGTAMQVAGAEVQLTRFGRLLQGVAVLLWASAAAGIHWTPARAGLLVLALLGGACLFYGLLIIQAAFTFWTVETLEVMNILTNGGTETAQYPLSIYRPWFRRFFTYVIPLACVSYFPAVAILDRPDQALGAPPWLQWTAPLVGGAFLLAALQLWRFGVRHYRSTGS